MRIDIASLRSIAFVLLVGISTWACSRNAPSPVVDADTSMASTRHDSSAEYSLYELPSVWRNQLGDSLQLSDLAGRVRVVAMVYTSCTVTCPLIIADLKRIEAAIPADQRDRMGFVLVSLDPLRDTPGRLAEWASRIGLDPTRWTLLRGDDSAVRELAASLETRYQRQADGEIAHTNGLTVLDGEGRMVHRQSGIGHTGATIEAVRALVR